MPSATEKAPPRFDPAAVRKDFPALQQSVNGKPLTYLDNAATTQKPEAVIQAVDHYYRVDNANVHRGIHELSRRATVAYEEARKKVGRWINAADPAEVVWTRGTTEALNLVAWSWGLDNLREDDEILLTAMEHHSNLVPWQLVAIRTGARLRWIEIDDQGRLVLDDLPRLINERTRVVAFTHVSNALGTINPVREIVDEVRARSDALVVVDGAQGAPHVPVDVQALGCDAYAFSGHKMCGPTGIGVLWARRSLLEAMPPWQGGGEMIRVVRREGSTWADVPHKFEAGTPNIGGAVGMGAAVDYLSGLDTAAVERHERGLVGKAVERLRALPGARVYGPDDLSLRAGVVPFTLGDAHPHDIATILDADGVAVRAGHHCAQLVMRRYDVAATARASFYLYNDEEDVERLVHALQAVQAIFGTG